MNWRFFAAMAAGMLRSAGIAKQMEDTNETGKDDLLGKGLVFAADFIEWLLAGMLESKKPTVPEAFK